MDGQPVCHRVRTDPLRPPRPPVAGIHILHHPSLHLAVCGVLLHARDRQAWTALRRHCWMLHAVHIPLPPCRDGYGQDSQRRRTQHHGSSCDALCFLLPSID